jgi:hypothetical protein
MTKTEITNSGIYGFGLLIIIFLFTLTLAIPGCIAYDQQKSNLRSEVINDLCNQNNGKYDFYVLDKTTYHYIEKVNENGRK